MKHSLLVTRPSFDLTTRYISAWAKKVISFAQEKGSDVFDLDKNRANRKEFESMITKNKPTLVFLNGHGDYNVVAGQDNEELLRTGDNERLLKSTVVYALSCRSGKNLGPSCVKSGVDAYIGYNEDFIFLYDENKRTRPEQDKIAEIFLEPSNQIMVSLLKDHAPIEAHKNSKQSFARRIRKLLSSQSTALESNAVRYLVWDMQNQVCCEKVNKQEVRE